MALALRESFLYGVFHAGQFVIGQKIEMRSPLSRCKTTAILQTEAEILALGHHVQKGALDVKGLSENNMVKIALSFWSDLVATIEQNRRRSRATSRIL